MPKFILQSASNTKFFWNVYYIALSCMKAHDMLQSSHIGFEMYMVFFNLCVYWYFVSPSPTIRNTNRLSNILQISLALLISCSICNNYHKLQVLQLGKNSRCKKTQKNPRFSNKCQKQEKCRMISFRKTHEKISSYVWRFLKTSLYFLFQN